MACRAAERSESSSPSPSASPFAGASSVLMGAIDRGVHRNRPLHHAHRAHRVVTDLNVFQELRPGTVRLPPGEPLIGRLPRPVPLRQITPRRTRAQSRQHPVNHVPVIPPRAPARVRARKQRLYPLPRRIRQLASTGHKINCQTRPRASRLDQGGGGCGGHFQGGNLGRCNPGAHLLRTICGTCSMSGTRSASPTRCRTSTTACSLPCSSGSVAVPTRRRSVSSCGTSWRSTSVSILLARDRKRWPAEWSLGGQLVERLMAPARSRSSRIVCSLVQVCR